MIQRLKICFTIIFCKKYIFTNCEKYVFTNNATIEDAEDLCFIIHKDYEQILIQESLLQEAKDILCQQ